MKKLLLIGAALFSTSALAQVTIQDAIPNRGPFEIPSPPFDYALIVNDSAGSNPIFSMGATGCLRGPLQIMDWKGRVLFSLTEGVDFPGDCSLK